MAHVLNDSCVLRSSKRCPHSLFTHFRPDGVMGVGEVSGLKYRGTGGTMEQEYHATDGLPAVYHMVNNFRIIGQGRGNNILVHVTVHQTLNANGELTSDVDLGSSECR